MSNKQKTPVQWFEQKLDDLDIEIPFRVFNEAKEMEAIKDKKYNEMLEMLKEVVTTYDNERLKQSITMGRVIDRAAQLIKESTEI